MADGTSVPVLLNVRTPPLLTETGKKSVQQGLADKRKRIKEGIIIAARHNLILDSCVVYKENVFLWQIPICYIK